MDDVLVYIICSMMCKIVYAVTSKCQRTEIEVIYSQHTGDCCSFVTV
jgi:hypothetical protein